MPEPITTVRIGTRTSNLAMWQAKYVKDVMEKSYPDVKFEIVGMSTIGDNDQLKPLSEFGVKGVFTKELDVGILSGYIDIAVHCLKDLATELPDGLDFCAVIKRASVEDCVILHPKYKEEFERYKLENPLPDDGPSICQALSFLKPGAIIGTSAMRRHATLQRYHPSLVCKDIRGNVNTRLRKLDEGQYDAIILAKVGLERLELTERISDVLSADFYLHAVGQGILAITCRKGETALKDMFMNALHDIPTCIAGSIERGMLYRLNGGCKVPIATRTKLFVMPTVAAKQHVNALDCYRDENKHSVRQFTIDCADLPPPTPIPVEDEDGTTTQSNYTTFAPSTITNDGKVVVIETQLTPPQFHTLDAKLDISSLDIGSIILKQEQLIMGGETEDSPRVKRVIGEQDGDDRRNSKMLVDDLANLDIESFNNNHSYEHYKQSILVITRAAVLSPDGQSYIETVLGCRFPLYKRELFMEAENTLAWQYGLELGEELLGLGANTILNTVRPEDSANAE